MDALLKELEAEKLQAREPVPDHSKKGWFVEPHEEHSTTNIFVRNLAPDISEQAVYQVFGQFGETGEGKQVCVALHHRQLVMLTFALRPIAFGQDHVATQ